MKYFIYKFVVYWKYKIHSKNSMSKSILGDTTKTNEIEVKYIHPIYGCNPVYIKHEGNLIMLPSRLCSKIFS